MMLMKLSNYGVDETIQVFPVKVAIDFSFINEEKFY